MLTAEWCKKLSTGEIITEAEILSPFAVYRDCKSHCRFLLMPIQNELHGVFIVANATNVRLFCNSHVSKSICYNVQLLLHKNDNVRLELVDRYATADIRNLLCDKLLQIFDYQYIGNNWIIKLK